MLWYLHCLLNTSGWIPLFSFPAVMQIKEIIPGNVNFWHTRSRPFPNHHATSSRTHREHYSFTSSVMPPPGTCFRGNVNHSGKSGECLSGKHLGENCSMASLSRLRIALPIQFSTSETPMGTLLLLSFRASDSLKTKNKKLVKDSGNTINSTVCHWMFLLGCFSSG